MTLMLPGELATLQNIWIGVCDTTATVQRNANLGVPNTDASWTTIYPSLPAVADEPTGSALQVASALVDQSVWQVKVPATWQDADVDIRRGDLVTLGLVPVVTLTVQHILHPESYSLNTNFIASKPR